MKKRIIILLIVFISIIPKLGARDRADFVGGAIPYLIDWTCRTENLYDRYLNKDLPDAEFDILNATPTWKLGTDDYDDRGSKNNKRWPFFKEKSYNGIAYKSGGTDTPEIFNGKIKSTTKKYIAGSRKADYDYGAGVNNI